MFMDARVYMYTNLCIFRDCHFEKVFEKQVVKICLYRHAPLNKPQLHACTYMHVTKMLHMYVHDSCGIM